MKNYIGRYNHLKSRLNDHLSKLTGLEKDYFSAITQNELLDLKVILADINNLLTLKMTVSSAEWLCNYFQLDSTCKQMILAKVDDTKPNTNGFDILVENPEKIIAEVKCIVPINKGEKYGAAQWNSILDDAIKLRNGKGKFSDTSGYYKFLFLIDLGQRTDQAISQLLRHSKGTSDLPLRANRHIIKEHIILLLDSNNMDNLLRDKVYIKPIKLE